MLAVLSILERTNRYSPDDAFAVLLVLLLGRLPLKILLEQTFTDLLLGNLSHIRRVTLCTGTIAGTVLSRTYVDHSGTFPEGTGGNSLGYE